jgi:DNA-binding transcriptional LysR family regulator
MVSLVRTGYGLATLPRAAIASALESSELIALEDVPDLAPLSVTASRRRQSESPLAEAVVRLAVEAARAFSSRHRAGLVVVDGDRI